MSNKLLYSRSTYLVLFIVFLVCGRLVYPGPLFSQEIRTSDDIIEQVVKYIKNVEPLETYDDKIREVRIQKTCLIDIDHDQVFEVIVWVKPYYHQTPPIFIYQVPDEKNRMSP